MSDDENNNIINFSVVNGGKQEQVAPDNEIPCNTYSVMDRDGIEHFADGFLVFTSQHIAIMKDDGKGSLPVLVIPLDHVAFAEIVPDEDYLED